MAHWSAGSLDPRSTTRTDDEKEEEHAEEQRIQSAAVASDNGSEHAKRNSEGDADHRASPQCGRIPPSRQHRLDLCQSLGIAIGIIHAPIVPPANRSGELSPLIRRRMLSQTAQSSTPHTDPPTDPHTDPEAPRPHEMTATTPPHQPPSSDQPDLCGSLTHTNLSIALSALGATSLRALWFAQQADVEGMPDAARRFRSIADDVTSNAFGIMEFLADVADPMTGQQIGDTVDNVAAAMAAETHDRGHTYPAFAETATAEGFAEIADWFDALAGAAARHVAKLSEDPSSA